MTKNDEVKELISFYNVENLFSPDLPPVHHLDPTASGLKNWDEKRYRNKLSKIAHVFQLIEQEELVLPMLIGISEIQGQTPLEDLVLLPPFESNYGVIHYDSMDERGVDVALLFDKRKVEIIFSEPITYFFELVDQDPANYDTTRDVLHCKLKFQESIFNVFVLHLPSKRERDINLPKRNYILAELRKKIIEIQVATNEPVVICGDFNDNPDEKSMKDFLVHSNNEKNLLNPSEYLFMNGEYSTFYYKNGLLFDQIILSTEFFNSDSQIHFVKAKVFNHEKLSNRNSKFSGRPFRTYAGTRYLGGYSDHFPVYVQLAIKKNKDI